MLDIMNDIMQQCVPTISLMEQVSVPETDIPVLVTMDNLHYTLLGKCIPSILLDTCRKNILRGS